MCPLDLAGALKALLVDATDPELRETAENVKNSLMSNTIHLEVAINLLSEHILSIENAKLFKRYLSNTLLALVSAKIPLAPVFSSKNYDVCSDTEKISHLDYSTVLAVLTDHPDILQYTLKYFEINPVPPFDVFIHHEDSYNIAPKKRRLANCRQRITDHQIVMTCFTLLTKFPNELTFEWDWTKFIEKFMNHDDYEIRWMVKECMVVLTNMTEPQSNKLAKALDVSNDAILKWAHDKSTFIREIDEIMKDQHFNKKSVVNIDGIMLSIYGRDNIKPGKLFPANSTVNNLRSLALAVASGKAVSLLGPVGSGKTSLVEHLAAITGRKDIAFKKVQLGDQTDSRMLLGSHQCTDVPGEFIWRPGVLTEAVQNGHWLLLEDIDTAALDVASTLSSMLERGTLCVPGYRDALPVAPGFQLFVTQRSLVTNYGLQKKITNSSTLLQKHLTIINIEPLSRSELGEIIQKLFPNLASISAKMIEVFMMFSVGSHDTSFKPTEIDSDKDNTVAVMRGSRLVSTRDLMKWCTRSVQGFDVSSAESALKVLQDALDIFTCSVSSPENRLELAKKVGTWLGIVETKSEFYCKHHKPNVSLTPKSLDVGRASVPRIQKSLESIDLDNKQVVFSFTRQSACLLERISCCVTSNEPVLLVGETGTGKTSSIQYLARQTGHKLVVINMNQQSDSADLLGGYKPVDMKYVIRPIKKEFEALFCNYYNVDKNKKFLGHIESCYDTENWTALLTLMKQSNKAAVNRLLNERKEETLKAWLAFGNKLNKLEIQIKAASKLTFAFIEGSLVKAMQEGHWVLLDEINLASAEILECLAGLLEDKSESIDLIEKSDKVPVKLHPDFTLFACMNPATDVGKKDLPAGLRNRFTEFFVDELTEKNDLMLLIGDYLYHMNLSGSILEAIYQFYANIRKEAKLSLVDGAGHAPHYSLRTLCRALTAAAKAKCGTVARSLYEAFCLSFLTQLDSSSHPKVEAMIAKAVLGKKNVKSILNQIIPEPQITGRNFLLFEGHWIPQGKLDIEIPEGYILTSTVRKNLRDIARIISLSRLPVLLQGDTSVGKTSLITYIAKASGNYCVRINNHEHTDLQEYIGSYATDASGKLVFKEGVLVEAMRKGYWIILDELNLAPSDVLEALNRVLDENRELFIPETQQVVKADPNFMLFATQNPPGLYGGRKMLSRAFRNRFVELHFDEIPKQELEIILHQRCHVPPAYCKKMIAVMAELQIRRRGSAAVQGKDGFITLRDLFRWGQRYKHAFKDELTNDKFYDWDQHIADEGYLILAGKVRQTEECSIIGEVIEKQIKRKVSPDNLFNLHQTTSPVTKSILESILNNQLEEFSHVVWTYNMRRLAVLIAKAFAFDEPVLLVGETGCGKTTICQVLAALSGRQLLSVNCHMHTESTDFLGGLRPVRQYKDDGRLFQWVDGPLVKAMENGDLFLADEISLADDSVLERMNSLLEPERQLVLAERGVEENADIVVITANKNFHFISTMNPGGDFGKKELSPALRNRFTEIWCDSVTSRDDLLKVLERSVNKGISLGNQEDGSSGIGNSILDFTNWLKRSEVTNKFPFSIRDLLTWVQFVNAAVTKGILETPEAYVHGACMTFLDCFGTALTGHIESETLSVVRKTAIDFLLDQIKTIGNEYIDNLREMLSNKHKDFHAETNESKFGIKPFYIDIGPNADISEQTEKFTFTAPTTGTNTLRLLRALQLNKAILLEGNPGVGKTSLVTALAKSSGHKVTRINLSDQTDITDLFGTDLPTEDGTFTFKEGAFLTALQNGDWILLDELNLAPQPVLEGLNACLDHRGEVFIPELGKTFKVKSQTRLFACQNPLKQGGARRGLPVSFLNRFTQVYVDTLTKEDLIYIVESQYPSLPKDILHRIVSFTCKVAHEVSEIQSWGHRGAPWEMNLRDIQRWCEALIKDQNSGKSIAPGKFADMLYINRMRTNDDKEKMTKMYSEFFCPDYPLSDNNPQFMLNDNEIIIGDVTLERNIDKWFLNRRVLSSDTVLLRHQMTTLKALAQSVKMNWLSILVGPSATGKSTIVQMLADLTGNDLQVIPVTSAMDVSDLLGGFEQVDYNRSLESISDKIKCSTIQVLRNIWLEQDRQHWTSNKLLTQLHQYKNMQNKSNNTDPNEEISQFKEKIQFLLKLCQKLVEHSKFYSETTKRLDNVINELKHLEFKVGKVTSVNTAGKFEWVDSLLVKTMNEGSWLLLDNVNLTSAAVLDRLNGLLEPNGVLSIPERGDVPEIKPHPNFRVFFTMDPKYGEISRAMRNRGVEIYLIRFEDWFEYLVDVYSHIDLSALLSSCGIPMEQHDLLINAHELLATFVHGLDRPILTHLLQAAQLTWQQIVRAMPIKEAILNSFQDVYIKPRCVSDVIAANAKMTLAEFKSAMLSELHELICKMRINHCSSDKHSLSVKGLCNYSLLETTTQLAYSVVHIDDDWDGYKKMMSYMLFNLYVAYQRCPKECMSLLHEIINRIYEERNDYGNTCQQFGVKLNNTAYTYLESTSDYFQHESYKRFLPELYKLEDKAVCETNTEFILLFIELTKCYTTHLKQTNSEAEFSFIDYSEAVRTGTLTDDFTEYPLLKHCKNYLDIVDTYIERAVKTIQGSLTDKTYCYLLPILNWRNRFYEMCTYPMFISKDGKTKSLLKENHVTMLYVHTKWLQKYLFGELFRLLPPQYDLANEFNNNVENMIVNVEQNVSEMSRVSKKFRKLYGQPRLNENEKEYNICLTRAAAYKQVTLDLSQPLEKQLDKFSAVETDISHAWDVPDKESSLYTLGHFKTISNDNDSNLKLKIKELPIDAYILHRTLNLLKNVLFNTLHRLTNLVTKNIFLDEANNVLLHLTNFGSESNIIPPELMNLLLFVQDLQVNSSRLSQSSVSSVFFKFWDEFYKALVMSPATYPLPFFNVDSPSNEVNENIPANTKKFLMNSPLLPYYAQKLTISKENDSRHVLAYETVSIKNQRKYSTQLDYMANVIWKNMAFLDIATRTTLDTNATFEIRKFEQLLICLLNAVKIKRIMYINTIHPGSVQELYEYFKDDTVFADMLVEANKLCTELRNDIRTDRIKTMVVTAQLSLLTSLLSIKLMAEVKPVDYVEKYRLKARYIEEDLEMFDLLLGAYYMNGVVYGSITEDKKITNSKVTMRCLKIKRPSLAKVHPHCSILLDLRINTAIKIYKYTNMSHFRPKEPTYDSFAKYCKHFTKSVLSPKTISELAKNLTTASNNLLKDLQNDTLCKTNILYAGTIIKEATSWLYSVNAFYHKIESDYTEAFPDLAKPLRSSISQTVYSVTTLKDLLKKIIVKIEQGGNFSELTTNLMKFPSTIPSRQMKAQFLNRFLSPHLKEAIDRNVNNEESIDVQLEKIQVLKMNLTELSMYCNAFEYVDSISLEAVLNTLGTLVETWQKQQTDIEKKKQDDEALYVTKSKCEDEDEEALAQEEIKEMFPSFTDNDFSEFKPSTLEQIPPKILENKCKPKQVITTDDVSLVYNWHSNFVRNLTRAEWLSSPKKLFDNDVISPSLQRYSTFSRIIENAWEALDAELEGVLTPGLMVILSHIKGKVDGKDDANAKIDFYHSPWVTQVSGCVSMLKQVKNNTDKLLEQWPDFPTLKDITVIINRILSFPLKSPVSRFLTGLELLRDKVEEWNKNAHKGNNLVEDSLQVGQQIISWRKLEMMHWKECLNNLYQRKQAEAHKYWFYLYNVVKSYLEVNENSDPIPASRVISVLKDFMEKSNLVEYAVRLDIIYVYHCHLVHLQTNERRDELLSILWNTYNYYSQFSAQVASHIKEKRAPIEKKLREFVKICSWDRDLSYWSVKDTVDKAHKALHKHTKEFENILKESVATCLVDKSTEKGIEHVGIWDRPKRTTNASSPTGGAYMIDTQNFVLLVRNVKKYLDQAEQSCNRISEGSLLSKVPSLLNKAKVLCKDTMNNTRYPSLVQALDDFVTVVIETSTHLGSLEVDASAPKDTQISQAKSFVQQKRKALADLFKYLAKMGLNYRTGLVVLAACNEDLYDFTIPPVDLDATMSYLKSRRCDATLNLLWSGCEKYFQKNIARHRFLVAALQTAHKDLGIQNIERCKGFAAQLMKMTNTQKKSISKYSRYLYDLRIITTNLTNAVDVDVIDTNITLKIEMLTECYAQCSVSLDQFSVLWRSLPDMSLEAKNEIEFDSNLSNSPLVRCYKNNHLWREVNEKINTIISDVRKQKLSLLKLVNSNPKQIGETKKDVLIISQTHIDVVEEATINLENIADAIDILLEQYQFKLNKPIENYHVTQHPVLRCLVDIRNCMMETLNKLEDLNGPNDVTMEDNTLDTLIDQTEDILATMLLVIQSVYKKYLPKDSKETGDLFNALDQIIDTGSKNEKEDSKELLEDKILKEHLQDKLSNDEKLLQLETLVNKTQNLLAHYMQYMASNKDMVEGKQVVVRLIPILEQVILFVQYFVTQKVAVHRVTCKMLSVLLKIFSDLATKGFCKPSELDTEEVDGDGGPGKLSSGTGLGEGEGQKDVSDRIENQDQLDEANRPGEEKKEEERDCKEEEKGVNMTDDFDSHLQDVEKKEGDDSEQENDEEDADKQMGDTDNAAEKLDQQIWGSEDEEDLEEEQEHNKKEEKGKGESTGEKEMGAKEEEQGTDDGSDGKDKKKKKQINEMDEPEIDDDHVDPYHGNHQPLPEPEDFEMPDNTNLDGDDDGDDKDGETETENPFEIDITKDDMPQEEENEQNDQGKEDKDNKHGFEVSSDEEDAEGGNEKTEDKEQEDKDKENEPEAEPETNQDDKENDNDEDNEGDPQDTTQGAEEPVQMDDNQENDELPKNPEKMEDEEVEQKNQDANPQANPSNNDMTAEDRAQNAEMDRGTDDNVETNDEQKKDEDAAPFEQGQEQVGEEKQAMGRSELDKSEKGHRGEREKASRVDSTQEKQNKLENKPGKTDQERTLGDVNEKKHKQMKTLNVDREEEIEESGNGEHEEEKDADAFQHVKQAQKDDLQQAIDAATKEQADEQPILQQEDEEAEAVKDGEDVAMDVDEEEFDVEKTKELKSEKMKEGTQKEKDKSGNKNDGGEERTGETGVEVEGDIATTTTVPRGLLTTYHTKIEEQQTVQAENLTVEQYMGIREWLTSAPTQSNVPVGVWRSLWQESAVAARALCEKLRLVLEPTGRSRKAGDFRTGRAINMRRVIPYIASHFRKDRIWLRRTKPAKREYKIAIAMDDSSSMSDNRSKELAFESLALVSQALNLLESGDLAVLSFGEKPNLLHPFTEQFSEHSGSKILEKLRFEQTKTKIAQLLDFCTVLFEEQTARSDAFNAKLLVIVSDGRGIFSEGETRVIQSVRRARQQGIFLVYVIIDNPDNKDSIMDIRRPVLDPITNTLTGFVPYLDTFPFPFYLILRDMTALPTVLGDALRQWFELAANTAS